MITTQDNVKAWLEGDYDEETKEAIRRMQPDELTDAFYRKLAFGTGGLRGIMGVGCNRLNCYTVGSATQGLANYLKSGKVLVGYDSRHHSKEFAEETARVLAANGIHVYIYDVLHGVPMVSYGCLFKKCDAAVMITASHNPPEYNGYKVYWKNGAQVLPPHDKGIIAEVDAVKEVTSGPLDSPLIEWISDEIDKAYLKKTFALQSYPKQNHARGGELKIVYTPLHGSGITSVVPALKNWGFSNVQLVESQSKPDGDFPTVESPNPEEHEALSLGIKQMLSTESDLLIGTDPDCDRVGVAVRHKGKATLLGGNQIACLCLDHLIKSGNLPSNPAVVKTIVTTELFRKIAATHGIPCFDTLTGFKYIGQLIDKWESEGSYNYLFGGEESYGYLLGTHARDKDAIISSCLIAELTLDAKLKGETLVDRMNKIYEEYGVYRERLKSLVFEGKQGADKMAAMMETLRSDPPTTVAGTRVDAIEDYLNGFKDYPPSNVLLLRLKDGTKVVIRPSGTEPKLKLYCGVTGSTIDEADHHLDTLLASLQSELL